MTREGEGENERAKKRRDVLMHFQHSSISFHDTVELKQSLLRKVALPNPMRLHGPMHRYLHSPSFAHLVIYHHQYHYFNYILE